MAGEQLVVVFTKAALPGSVKYLVNDSGVPSFLNSRVHSTDLPPSWYFVMREGAADGKISGTFHPSSVAAGVIWPAALYSLTVSRVVSSYYLSELLGYERLEIKYTKQKKFNDSGVMDLYHIQHCYTS